MSRVGIVGYGMAGRDIHRGPLTEAGWEIAAVVTGNAERAEQARSDTPGVEIRPTIDALLADRDELGLDLVVIASPSGAHAPNAHAAIVAGVPVVVDKPFALDADQALEVVDHAEREGVPLSVFQNRRYDPEFRTLADVVARGAVGEVIRFEHRWERWRPVPKDRWRERLPADQGGGIVLDLQTHVVDAAVRLFGPVGSVFASIRSITTDADDDAFLALLHESGVESHLITSSVAGAPGPRVRLLGREAAYLLANLEPEPSTFAELANADGSTGWLYRGDEREPVPTVAGGQDEYYRQVATALGAPDPQAAMPVDPHDAVHVMAVIDAARIASDEQRVVEVITPGVRPD
jgi:predicted dehydrogenase